METLSISEESRNMFSTLLTCREYLYCFSPWHRMLEMCLVVFFPVVLHIKMIEIRYFSGKICYPFSGALPGLFYCVYFTTICYSFFLVILRWRYILPLRLLVHVFKNLYSLSSK